MRTFASALAMVLAIASPAFAQDTAPLAAEAPAADALGALVAAINGSGDRADFVARAFSSRALQAESADRRAAALEKLAADSGGLDLVSSKVDGRMTESIVRTRRGGKFGKLVLFTAKAEPGKIADLFVLPARDPAKLAREAWPSGRLSTAAIAAEIGHHAAALAAEDAFSGVVLVAKGDRVVFERAYGFADLTWHEPNRTDTAFHVASIGKMFTAAAVLRLVGQGKLSLDDSVAKWVPEYRHPEAARITLRHLLTHSGGIGEWEGREPKAPRTGAQAAATMTQPLEFEPGARFAYSNAGYVLLGAAIEKVTGKPLNDALTELVFAPAGMTRTGLWPVTAIVPNRATGYLHREDDPLGLGPRFSNEQFLGFAGDGSGGEYSTARDLFAFLKALASSRLLGPELSHEMLTPKMDFAGAPRPSKYGYGVDLGSCAGHPIFGHEGGGANSGVSSLAYRTSDGGGWTVIVLSNYDPPAAGDLAFGICEFVAGR